jgi:hypothetical protein
METGLYSVAQIKQYLLSGIKPKDDICLIFYLTTKKYSTGDVDFKLERKAIPSYLKDEFLRRHGNGIRVPEKDVMEFIKEFNVNISEERIEDLIKRNYA